MSPTDRLPDNSKADPDNRVKAEGATPVRRMDRTAWVRDEDGVPTEIALPGLPSEWWLDPRGNIVGLPVQTTCDPKEQLHGPASYKGFIHRIKYKSGWLPWEGVPEMQYLPKGANPSTWLEQGRFEERAKRLAKAKKDVKAYNAEWERQKQAQAEMTAAALTAAMDEHETRKENARKRNKASEG